MVIRRRTMALALTLLASIVPSCRPSNGFGLKDAAYSGSLFISMDRPVGGQANAYKLLLSAAEPAASLAICTLGDPAACTTGAAGYQTSNLVFDNGTTKFFQLDQPLTVAAGLQLLLVAHKADGTVLESRLVQFNAGSGGTAAAVAASLSDGCQGGKPQSGVSNQSMSVNGASRSYVQSVPNDYKATDPHYLVLAFHGVSQSGKWMKGLVGSMEDQAKGKAVFLYPDGQGGNWDSGENSADLAFFDAMVAKASSDYCIDKSRIFAIGFSMGAYFTNRLGVSRANVLRGILPASGGPPGNAGGVKTAVMITHGKNDSWVNFSNGEKTRDFWATANGCGAQTSPFAGASACIQLSGCADGKPVVWCPWDGDHNWAPFASEAGWRFFTGL